MSAADHALRRMGATGDAPMAPPRVEPEDGACAALRWSTATRAFPRWRSARSCPSHTSLRTRRRPRRAEHPRGLQISGQLPQTV